MGQTMLSTTDNPYNPFTQWDEWYRWDEQKGYHTCGYLARIAISSDELSQHDQDLAIEMAIDEILKYNIYGNYVRVTQSN